MDFLRAGSKKPDDEPVGHWDRQGEIGEDELRAGENAGRTHGGVGATRQGVKNTHQEDVLNVVAGAGSDRASDASCRPGRARMNPLRPFEREQGEKGRINAGKHHIDPQQSPKMGDAGRAVVCEQAVRLVGLIAEPEVWRGLAAPICFSVGTPRGVSQYSAINPANRAPKIQIAAIAVLRFSTPLLW